MSGYGDGVLYRLNPQSLAIEQKIRVGAQARQSVVASRAVWTISQARSALGRFSVAAP